MLNTPNRKYALVRVMVIVLAIACLGCIVPFAVQADGEPEYKYIYLDLSAGNVVISGRSYTGYRYDGNATAQQITGTLQSNEAYYVYQSNGNKNTGVINGVWTAPATPSRVMHNGQPWGNFITNNTDVEGVIGAWITDAPAAGHKSTSYWIRVTGAVGNTTLVIDNIWSSHYQASTSRSESGISFLPSGSAASNLTVRFKGDNRFGAIHYGSSASTMVNGIETATHHMILQGEDVTDTLTVANLTKNSRANFWNAAIGGNDSSAQDSKGIVINNGTVFAGTNASDDCTAIGGGGNGYAIVDINGGRVTAVVTSSGAAIGGGIGKTSNGGQAVVSITGGEVYAHNNSCSSTYSAYGITYIPSAAIGGGSSARSVCSPCVVNITGGMVYAESVGGTAIGGGSSSDTHGGEATINIGGDAVVYAKSIGGNIGGNTVKPGVAIGGGTGGVNGNGGNVTLNIFGNPTIRTGSIGGGATIGTGKNIGNAVVDISGGDISGQIIMQAGALKNCLMQMTGGVIDNSNKSAEYVFTQSNGGAVYMNDPNGVATVSGGKITNCSAQNGGAIYMTAGHFTLSGTGEISYCKATANGGAIYLGGGRLDIEGGSIDFNEASLGGGAYLADGTLNVSGGGMYSNTATRGAGAYLGGGTLNVGGGEIHSNTAQEGAGAYLANGTLNVSGGEIRNNGATNGAGVYLADGRLDMLGGVIGNNTATGNGGGAYLADGKLNISGTAVIRDNSATNGGGAYVNGGDVTVKNGTIINNTASENGGGIAVRNGSYYMTGGNIDYNKAVTGQGGGVFITTDGEDVLVDVRSGSISYNEAGIQGGALSVDCNRAGTEHVQVNIGVNELHEIDGTNVFADHDQDSVAELNHCPVMQKNLAPKQAGAIFVKGGVNTVLNVYCLREVESEVTGEADSKSVFMKVEGGTVNITTAKDGDHDATCGYINIQNTVHITAGYLILDGVLKNPMFLEDITVDVIAGEGDLIDRRPRGKDAEYYVLIYFENFKDSATGKLSGQYTLQQFQMNETTYISGVIYQHPGYSIDGWYTSSNGTGDKYEVSGYCIFDGGDADGNNYYLDGVYHLADLTIHANWVVHGYFIEFLPNPDKSGDDVDGKMDILSVEYDVSVKLPSNQFVYPGHVFLYWIDANGTHYADQALVYNLTKTEGATVQLKAVWDDCKHLAAEVTFTYSASGNVLTRTCSCHGYTQSVSLTAETAIYDKQPHGATQPLTIRKTSVNQYLPDNEWILTVTYEGANLFTDPVPVNAGTYNAILEQGGAKAIFTYVIQRATQAAPNIPTFTVDSSAEPRKITVIPSALDTPTPEQYYEYRLTYYSGEGMVDLPWSQDALQQLGLRYTTYFVYIRYGQTMNYLPSDSAKANTVYYYDEYVDIRPVFGEGLTGFLAHGESIVGVNIAVRAESGYYRSHVSVLLYAEDENGNPVTGMKVTAIDDLTFDYNLSNIPSGKRFTIYLTIEGSKPITEVTSNVTENQIFKGFTSSSAKIGRDSAYTAYYLVSDYYAYGQMQLRFTDSLGGEALLPQGTSIILLDLSNRSYWYRLVTAPTSSVLLSDFTAMGGTAKFTDPTASELAFVFIVDFSQVDGGYPADKLVTELHAVPNRTAEPEVPDFATSAVSTSFVDVIFDIEVEQSVNMENHLEITFAQTSGGDSKWEHRTGALVLIPQTPLPPDAHIEVIRRSESGIKQTTYFLNSEGVFVIALTETQTTLNITLKALMNDQTQVAEDSTFVFDAVLYGVYSTAAQSPMNGEIMVQREGISFTKPKAPETALHLTSDQTVCEVNGRLNIRVEHQMPEGYILSMHLLRKQDTPDETGYISGEYVDTGFAHDDVLNSDYYTSETAEIGTVALPLGGQKAGSFCLEMRICDESGATVKTVSFYFLVANVSE